MSSVNLASTTLLSSKSFLILSMVKLSKFIMAFAIIANDAVLASTDPYQRNWIIDLDHFQNLI